MRRNTQMVVVAMLVAAPWALGQGRARADEARVRLVHLPPAEAAAGETVNIDARVEGAWQATIELRYRASGTQAWKGTTFRLLEGTTYRATVPPEVVAPPGFEYFIADAGATSASALHFASPEDPHRVGVAADPKVVRREAELAKFHGRRARVHVAYERVNFGERTITGVPGKKPDYYDRVDADFTYRVLKFPLHSLRFGYTYLLGETPATSRGGNQMDCDAELDGGDGDCEFRAGFKVAGWFELRLRASSLVDVDVRGLVAATKTSFNPGGRVELRIGAESGSHVALGGEAILEAGSTGYFRLGWDTVPGFPMAATIELSNLPSTTRATAVRLIYDVSHPFDGGVRIGLRAGYSARDSNVGSVSLGGSLSLDF